MHLKWITDKDVLNSTGPLLNFMWQPGCLREMDTCICMTESHCCSPETITTLFVIDYTLIQNKELKKERIG